MEISLAIYVLYVGKTNLMGFSEKYPMFAFDYSRRLKQHTKKLRILSFTNYAWIWPKNYSTLIGFFLFSQESTYKTLKVTIWRCCAFPLVVIKFLKAIKMISEIAISIEETDESYRRLNRLLFWKKFRLSICSSSRSYIR